jgi:SHC-transforming protein 1
VKGILGDRPRLEHAGSDVLLVITSTCLKMKSWDTGAIIAVHDMPNISFASGGDSVIYKS